MPSRLHSDSVDAVQASPHDVVLRYPALSPGIVRLVGFDSTGFPRIEVELDATRAGVEAVRLLDWVRHEYPSKIRLLD